MAAELEGLSRDIGQNRAPTSWQQRGGTAAGPPDAVQAPHNLAHNRPRDGAG